MTTQRKPRAKRPKPGQQLKSFFAIGGIATTLLGANFLANREIAAAPAPQQQFVLVDTVQASASATDNPYLSDAPIQQLVIPEPVARSQSS